MKITKIEKKKRLYLLELDDHRKAYITEDTIVRFLLSKGKVLTEEEWQTIQEFAQLSYGKNLGLYYLSFKQRTRKEVADYLMQHEVDPDLLATILSDLEEGNWINDTAYVEQAIRQNLASGDKGPHALRQKLYLKGIPHSLIDQQLALYDFSEVAERAGQKLLRKYQHRLNQRALKDKILQGLMTKGFDYPIAKDTLSQLETHSDEELETELLYQEMDKLYRKYSRTYDGYELKQRLTQALFRKGFDYGSIQSALRDYL